MANVKKITIGVDELPFIQSDSESLYYSTRYRVISEDRNRFSHWSPIYRINFPSNSDAEISSTETLPYTSQSRIHLKEIIGTGENTLLITWSHPQTYYSKLEEIFDSTTIFDIYVRWGTTVEEVTTWTDWQYLSRISSDTFSILKPDAEYTDIDFEVQIPNSTSTRDTRLTLFKLEETI